jgi:hypothetical protein
MHKKEPDLPSFFLLAATVRLGLGVEQICLLFEAEFGVAWTGPGAMKKYWAFHEQDGQPAIVKSMVQHWA